MGRPEAEAALPRSFLEGQELGLTEVVGRARVDDGTARLDEFLRPVALRLAEFDAGRHPPPAIRRSRGDENRLADPLPQSVEGHGAFGCLVRQAKAEEPRRRARGESDLAPVVDGSHRIGPAVGWAFSLSARARRLRGRPHAEHRPERRREKDPPRAHAQDHSAAVADAKGTAAVGPAGFQPRRPML